MAYQNNITILVADNDNESRTMIAGLLASHGYKVVQATDGGSALKEVRKQPVDVAIVAEGMSPRTGFDFLKDLIINNYEIGTILLSSEMTTDLLLEAGKYEIKQVMRKPVEPDRLSETVRRVLRAYNKNPDALAAVAEPVFDPPALMKRALALAQQNARSRMGGPFGAVVADPEGRIIGEGVNGVTTRCDPTAHAEVMAIRRATERMGSTYLSGCTIYCSSEPTMLGQALIISTGISKVFYGLSHKDVGATRLNEEGIFGEINKPLSQRAVPYERLAYEDALDIFRTWQGQGSKLSD